MKHQIWIRLMVAALVLSACQSSKTSNSSSSSSNHVLEPGKIVSPETFQQVPAEQIVPVDLAAGGAVYQKGTSQGVAACLSCHGANGEGQAAAGFPRLANQSKFYLLEQLQNYKKGIRKNPVMMPIAQNLNESEMQNVSAYIEQMKPAHVTGKNPVLSASQMARARELVEVGDFKLNLQACNNCHGPAGVGEPPNVPSLAGQSSLYIQNQLRAWRSGERTSSLDRMGYVAKLLTDSDIKLVADYFQQLPGSKVEGLPPEIRSSPVKH